MSDRQADGMGVVCDALRSIGITCVFGVPGTQNVALFEGFRRARLRTVLSSHELAASFMANGYFRATGRVAVLATIPGPGFTYALTGLAEARLDSAAILYLVGQPATRPGRRFQLQALDQRSIAGPLLKGTFALDCAADATGVVREAYAFAMRGEPGPVMIEMDLAALASDTPGEPRRERPVATPEGPNLEPLGQAFAAAQRPVFYLGQGAFASAERLVQLAESLGIPVVTTPTARGILPEDRPMSIPFDPLRGNLDAVNQLFDGADLILALGCKLGHNGSAGFELRMPADRLIHLDAEPGTAGANYDTRLSLTVRVEDALPFLEARRAPARWDRSTLSDVRTRVRAAPRGESEPVYHGSSATRPLDFFAWLRRALPRDAIVVTDSGFHQILTRRHFDVLAPRGLIIPSDLQSMGFGLPAAIGAKLGAPDRQVVAMIGDGGFLMSGLELLTARREAVAVTTIVFNDGQLNQIRMQQWAQFGHAHAVGLLNPDFQMLAAALGVDYVRFGDDTTERVEDALRASSPTLIEVLVGDSLAMRRKPAVARVKNLVRWTLSPSIRGWLKARIRRKKT